MRVPRSWLEEFINIKDISTTELAETLTMLGLEVEEIRQVLQYDGSIKIGEIKAVENHPKADRLVICHTDIGGKILKVVTSDTTVKVGEKIPTALPGTKIFSENIEEEGIAIIHIGISDIRGVMSEAMFLSKQEVGLEEKSSQLWRVSNDISVGTELREVYPPDWILEVSSPSNRADVLSIYGIARELATKLNIPLKPLEIPKIKEELEEYPQIKILAKDLCYRYSSRIIRGVRVKESPWWLKRKLELYGIRSINNIVDITNYILILLGHPMHAFDLKKLGKGSIIVRTANNGEKILTLDGVERELEDGMLVIADGDDKPVALAGIMGGELSGISDDTTEILLESAYFTPSSIRRTSRKLGIRTESSIRFERGADWDATVKALELATKLILEQSGGKVSKLTDVKIDESLTKTTISISIPFINARLGTTIPKDFIERTLKNLGFYFQTTQNDTYTLIVPTWRQDISIPEDIVEEIARFYGYNNIPIEIPKMSANLSIIQEDMKKDIRTRIRNYLSPRGFFEVINFSFLSEQEIKKYKLENSLEPIRVSNPMNKDQEFLKTFLFPKLLSNISHNYSVGIKDLSIFEIGKVFFMENNKETEKEKLGILVSGKMVDSWREKINWDYYELSGIVRDLLENLGYTDIIIRRGEILAFLHPYIQAEITVKGKSVGFIGKLHPDINEAIDIKQDIFIAEIDLDELRSIEPSTIAFEELPRYPGTWRDISMIVPITLEVVDIYEYVKNFDSKIKEVKVIDVYSGEPIPEGYRSVTISIFFQEPLSTLTDEEVNSLYFNLMDELEKHFEVKVRR